MLHMTTNYHDALLTHARYVARLERLVDKLAADPTTWARTVKQLLALREQYPQKGA